MGDAAVAELGAAGERVDLQHVGREVEAVAGVAELGDEVGSSLSARPVPM
jgi:hypothetical protein